MEIPGFFGRESELSWLRGLWDACTARDAQTGRFAGGPRMAVILAESGIGKSRLVQALYQQLTRDPEWDPPEVDYWPDAFNDQGVQLRVVPDMRGHVAKGPPRFAWIGTRWQPLDVMMLLLEFAASTGIDVTRAVKAKLAINAQRYPVDKSRGRATKYDRL